MRNMRRAIPALAIVGACLLAVPLCAQTYSHRADVFGGYSHVGNYGIGESGWIASLHYNFSDWVGAEADVSGNYGAQNFGAASIILPGVPGSVHDRMHSFDFGPRVTYRSDSEDYNIFGHALFGFSHTNLSSSGVSESSTSFSWVLGGGADYNLSDTWAARAQIDFLRTNFFDSASNHGRVAIGLVYRFD
jgi:opacity protein-like surface antigen